MILLISVVIRLVATVWSVVVLRRTRDWRALLLATLLALMTVRSTVALAANWGREAVAPVYSALLPELTNLAVSLLALLAVFALERLISPRMRIPLGRSLLTGRLTAMAFLIGSMTVIACFMLGSFAYRTSRVTMEQTIAEGNLAVARTLGHLAAGHVENWSDPDDRREFLDELVVIWKSTGARHEGSYLCAIDRTGTISLHTANPAGVGRNTWEVSLGDAIPAGLPRTVRDLARAQQDWSGRNISLSGIDQLVGYAWIPEAETFVVVHTPLEFVESELNAAALPWAVGLALIGGLLVPLALGLLHRSYVLEQRRARAAEAERLRIEQHYQHEQRMEGIGRLAGGVAHDFNNLLMAILGNSQALAAKLPADSRERVARNLGEIDRAAERAAGLTRQLLTFSRKHPMEFRPVDLNHVVEEARRMLERLIGENIRLDVMLEPDLPPINGDPGVLEQVLVNLVVNSRDAMPDGGNVMIETRRVRVDRKDDLSELVPGEHVAIVVTDDGCGMSVETRSKIFEPFFTTKPIGEGTGLGLSTVYAIVSKLGGTIRVSSEPGRGSSFTVYLPVDTSVQVNPVAPVPLPVSSRGKKLLVVEDDPAVLQLLADVLEDAGFEVLRAEDGKTAVSRAENCSGLDMVVSDVILPDTDGRTLAHKIVKLHPGAKVLFVSGYTGDVIGRHGVLDPGVDFLAKPFPPGVLVRRIGAMLGQKERRTASRVV